MRIGIPLAAAPLLLGLNAAPASAATDCRAGWHSHVSSHEVGSCNWSSIYHARNSNSTALGCYQMTNAALQDIGLKDAEGNWQPNRSGIASDTEFAANIGAQNDALGQFSALNWSRISQGSRDMIGTDVSGVTITEGGSTGGLPLRRLDRQLGISAKLAGTAWIRIENNPIQQLWKIHLDDQRTIVGSLISAVARRECCRTCLSIFTRSVDAVKRHENTAAGLKLHPDGIHVRATNRGPLDFDLRHGYR